MELAGRSESPPVTPSRCLAGCQKVTDRHSDSDPSRSRRRPSESSWLTWHDPIGLPVRRPSQSHCHDASLRLIAGKTPGPAESAQTGSDPVCGPGPVTAMIMTIMGEIRRRRRPTRKVTAGRHARCRPADRVGDIVTVTR
jgi:hypothetical protein